MDGQCEGYLEAENNAVAPSSRVRGGAEEQRRKCAAALASPQQQSSHVRVDWVLVVPLRVLGGNPIRRDPAGLRALPVSYNLVELCP